MIHLTVETRTVADALAQMDDAHRQAGETMAATLTAAYPAVGVDSLALMVAEALGADDLDPDETDEMLGIEVMARVMEASTRHPDGFLFMVATVHALTTAGTAPAADRDANLEPTGE